MKWFCIVALIAISYTCRAQELFLGQTKKSIQERFNGQKDIYAFKPVFLEDNLIEMNNYIISPEHDIAFYYSTKTDTCLMVVELFLSKKYLISAIEDMNNRFERIDDDNWITKDNRIKIFIEKAENTFKIKYLLI